MKFKLSIILIIFCLKLSAQEEELNQINKREAYPVLNTLSIKKDFFGKSNFKLKDANNHQLTKGEFSSERLRIYGLLPLYTKNVLSISASVIYTRENTDYYSQINQSENNYNKSNLSRNDFDAFFTAIYRGKLFGKFIINNATLTLGSTNFFDVKKVSGILSSTMLLKMTPTTRTSIGILGSFDRSAIIPVFPFFTYWHKFSDSPIEIDAILPQKVVLRMPVLNNGWLSAGTELNGSSVFTKNDQEKLYLPGNYEWVSTEMHTHIGYEQLFAKRILIGAKAGYRNLLTSRLIKVYDKVNNYEAKLSGNSIFFSMNAAFIIPNNALKKNKR